MVLLSIVYCWKYSFVIMVMVLFMLDIALLMVLLSSWFIDEGIACSLVIMVVLVEIWFIDGFID